MIITEKNGDGHLREREASTEAQSVSNIFPEMMLSGFLLFVFAWGDLCLIGHCRELPTLVSDHSLLVELPDRTNQHEQPHNPVENSQSRPGHRPANAGENAHRYQVVSEQEHSNSNGEYDLAGGQTQNLQSNNFLSNDRYQHSNTEPERIVKRKCYGCAEVICRCANCGEHN